MTVAIDRELVERWRQEPAPLLPLLHVFHERDGFLAEEALRAISTGLRIPLPELFGTVTFYHHLSCHVNQEAPEPRVSTPVQSAVSTARRDSSNECVPMAP